MQHFTRVLRAQTIMFLDASVGGTIMTKNEYQVKKLIERMCHNEYRSISDQIVKSKGMLALDLNTIVLA